MLGDLAPDRQEPGRLILGVGREIVKVMDVDHHAQALAQAGIHQFVGPGEDFGPDAELRPRTGVMVPADRDADVVESFGAHDSQVVGRVVDAPVLAGWCFQAVAQVGPAEEPPGREVSRRRSAGDRLHIEQVRRRGPPER